MQLESCCVATILMINDDICCSASTQFCIAYPSPKVVSTKRFSFIIVTVGLNMHLECVTQAVYSVVQYYKTSTNRKYRPMDIYFFSDLLKK